MSVRAAHAGDADAVLGLMAELGRPPVADDPAEQRAVFREHLGDPRARMFVAEEGGTIVGIASFWLRPRLNWTTLEAWIPDLVVDPAARRRGHARALLDACAAEARRHGCHRLVLESSHQRAEAHRLYEAYGFEHDARSYRLPLT